MDSTDDEPQSAQRATRSITVGTLIASASLAVTLLVWSHTVFVGLIDWIVDMDRRVATNTQARLDHDQQFQHWIGEITANRRGIRQAERDLADLRTLPHARADAFTGADGEALQRRLEHLEQQVSERP